MMPKSMEEALIKSQVKKRFGIFACNDYAIISKEKRWIGQDECDEDVWTWKENLPVPKRGHCNAAAGQTTGCTNSFLNAGIFMIAWDSLMSSGVMWKSDWIVKADPDAVLFVDRLRHHMLGTTGDDAGLVQNPTFVAGNQKFFTTCWYNSNGGGLLYGSLEVFTKQA